MTDWQPPVWEKEGDVKECFNPLCKKTFGLFQSKYHCRFLQLHSDTVHCISLPECLFNFFFRPDFLSKTHHVRPFSDHWVCRGLLYAHACHALQCCRRCGKIFCDDCTAIRIPLPPLSHNPVRVCERYLPWGFILFFLFFIFLSSSSRVRWVVVCAAAGRINGNGKCRPGFACIYTMSMNSNVPSLC